MAKFVPPAIQDNPGGWGPCALPNQFKDLPYQPFSKGDRLGKISDWFGNTFQDRRYQNKYSSAFGSGQQYAYIHEEDESSFQLVDTSRLQRPLYQRSRVKFNLQRQQRERKAAATAAKQEVLSKTQKSRERDRQRQMRAWQKNYGRQMQDNRNRPMQKSRDASVRVQESWTVLEEMDFTRLQKLNLPTVSEGEDLYTAGSLEYYDKRYDRINAKNDKRLTRMNRLIHTVTTTDDPIIRKLARQGTVFATDAILTSLMCCTRSVYPWDVVVQKVKDKIFLDKRDDADFDLLTVSETATTPPDDEGSAMNAPKSLSLEATYINHNFCQQVLKNNEKRYSFPNENPFVNENDAPESIGSVAYRYRRFDIGNGIQVVVRCELDGITQGAGGENQFVNIKALNEWDSKLSGGVDWRSKLDIQRGAVVATELKNNSFKMAKWTASALLAGSDQLKFGFVSRMSTKDSRNHAVLGIQMFKPAEFAQQMNLNMDNAWGILRCMVDCIMKLPDGKYLIMKDPNKPVVRIYDIPDNTFETTDDEDSDASDDDGGSGDNSESDDVGQDG